jgi:hypothetical protein
MTSFKVRFKSRSEKVKKNKIFLRVEQFKFKHPILILFVERFETFQKKAEVELRTLEKKFEGAMAAYNTVVVQFGEDPKMAPDGEYTIGLALWFLQLGFAFSFSVRSFFFVLDTCLKSRCSFFPYFFFAPC